MNNPYLTESKISWLSNQIYDLLWKDHHSSIKLDSQNKLIPFKYTTEQIYGALMENVYEHADENKYKILAALVYQKNIDQLKNELEILIKE